MIPVPLEQLIKEFSNLPGIGKRSAQRMALQLLTHREGLGKLQQALSAVDAEIKTCSTCSNISLGDPCHICTDEGRDKTSLCVVEGVDDLWAMERSGAFKGYYHILGGVVSAIDGVGPEDLTIDQLVNRVKKGAFKEVILALGASVDGQTTAHLISRKLKPLGVDVSALARGIPIGAEVDYMDDGTLSLALKGRQVF